jgi:hypothetical protein
MTVAMVETAKGLVIALCWRCAEARLDAGDELRLSRARPAGRGCEDCASKRFTRKEARIGE